jgi:hypothetical protein
MGISPNEGTMAVQLAEARRMKPAARKRAAVYQ